MLYLGSRKDHAKGEPCYKGTILQRYYSTFVVECLSRDQGVAGSSLTDVTVCVLEQDTFILA